MKAFSDASRACFIPSAKGSGVGLGVCVGGVGLGLLTVGDGVGVEVTEGVAAGGVGDAAIGVGIAVGVGVEAGVDGVFWHWQSKRIAALMKTRVRHIRTPNRTCSATDLLMAPGCRRSGMLSESVERFVSDI
jgi:hypothetical protein